MKDEKTYITYNGKQYNLIYKIERQINNEVVHELILDGRIFSGKTLMDVVKKLQKELDKNERR